VSYPFQIHKDSYLAIITWLEIIKEYDDLYIKSSIANFKSRKILNNSFLNKENNIKTSPHISIDNINKDLLEKESFTFQIKNDDNLKTKYEIAWDDNFKPENLEDGLENLSDKISLFKDEDDDNSIFFMK
jgi:hypothetical protein